MRQKMCIRDSVSGGEIFTAVKAGFPSERICFHGNNKTNDELTMALDNNVGRALGIPYNTVDTVSKMIPRELGMTIEKALTKNQELKALYDKDAKIRELVDPSELPDRRRRCKNQADIIIITINR